MRIEEVEGLQLSPSPLVRAFLTDFGQVSSAYEYDWSKAESYRRRAEWLQSGGYKGDRRRLAAVLTRYNRALGAGPDTLASLQRLAEDSALVVVTGQQAGIFSGPAYSIYKAMTAVHLAQRETARLGVPVLPVFWIAGEDHDWQEVSWVLVPSGDGMTRLALKESFAGERRSVGLGPVPASLADLMQEFRALLPETEFTPEVARRIEEAATVGPALDPALTEGKPSLTDWFGRLMTWLFEGTGLIICNSADPDLRGLAAPFFARAIRQQEEVEAALGRGYDLFERLGYKPTVERQLGSLNLFTYIKGERLPLMGAGAHCWIRDREEIGWAREDLTELALAHPERFSTNVVLRPVVQGYLFPDLAYVGGPGEVSYFGLYREVYRQLEQQMPVIVPRESFTLVEPPLARILEKQDLSLADVFFRLEEKRQEVLEKEDRLGIGQLFDRFRTDLGQSYDNLVETLLQLDPSLRFVAEENKKQISVQVNRLEEKARQQHRKNCEVALRQFDRLKGHLLPEGGLQERSVSILPYLAKYGPDLVSRLLAETAADDTWRHQVVFLGT